MVIGLSYFSVGAVSSLQLTPTNLYLVTLTPPLHTSAKPNPKQPIGADIGCFTADADDPCYSTAGLYPKLEPNANSNILTLTLTDPDPDPNR